MLQALKNKTKNLLLWSQKYTKTDMLYLARGGFWLTLEQVLATAAGFILAFTLANYLPKKAVGTYKFVISVAAIFAVTSLRGMGASLIRSVAQKKEGSFIPILKTKIKWGLAGSFIALIAVGYYYVNSNFILAKSFLIVAFFLPFYYSLGLTKVLLLGRKKFDLDAKYIICTDIISILITAGIVILTHNPLLVIFTYFASYTTLRLLALIFILKKYPINKKVDAEAVPLGKHLSLMGVIKPVARHIDKLIIWHFLGASVVAVYYFALMPPVQIRKLLANINNLALPKFSERNFSQLKKTLPGKLLKFGLFILFSVLVYVVFAPFVFKIFFPKYMSAVKYSQIFSLTLLFFPVSLLNKGLIAHARKKELYIINFLYPSSKILLLLVLLPLYGIWGGITALITAEIIHLIITFILFKRA